MNIHKEKVNATVLTVAGAGVKRTLPEAIATSLTMES